ncbi:UNVERIFIED_CONTAM: Hydroquinone glucosyltransferase [Sesamum latifolium]|uniref:Hydroquinone glucosyltransferase n=1 Tax=Sesamum latifolium TaxID=2727402 RepID=A0AAW2XLE1_9LAMI
MKQRNSEVHKWALDWCNKFLEADGVMVNSFLELETEAFKDLEQRRPDVPPVYPVGPLIRTGTEAESDRGGGTLSVEQFNELALGLEMSGHRRVLERIKGRGLVWASWAPQIQVLSHRSTGGFVTHCGWNSILESTVFGVPMIAWPLCFEHRMNAVFLTDGLKGAIRVKENENGVVGESRSQNW